MPDAIQTATGTSISEYLNCKPECTQWRKDYCRSTAFAFEPQMQTFMGPVTWGARSTAMVNRAADLLENLAIYIELPLLHNVTRSVYASALTGLPNPVTGAQHESITDVHQAMFAKLCYVDSVGVAAMGQSILRIGNSQVDQWDANSCLMWAMQNSTNDLSAWRRMVGAQPRGMSDKDWLLERRFRASGRQAFWINLPLWFTTNSALALPLVALMYNDIQLQITPPQFITLLDLPFAPTADINSQASSETAGNNNVPDHNNTPAGTAAAHAGLLALNGGNAGTTGTAGPTDAVRAVAAPAIAPGTPNFPTGANFQMQVLGNYVFLDQIERRLFGRSINEYVGEATQTQTPLTIAPGSANAAIPLHFNYPTASITVFVRDTTTTDLAVEPSQRNATNRVQNRHPFNYVTGYGPDFEDSFDTMSLRIHGVTRIEPMPASYYRAVSYWRHSHQSDNSYRIYTMPFCVNMWDTFQPSGHLHFGQADNATLLLTWDGNNLPFTNDADGGNGNPGVGAVSGNNGGRSPNSAGVTATVIARYKNIFRTQLGVGGWKFGACI
jgi:hypothetical protein